MKTDSDKIARLEVINQNLGQHNANNKAEIRRLVEELKSANQQVEALRGVKKKGAQDVIDRITYKIKSQKFKKRKFARGADLVTLSNELYKELKEEIWRDGVGAHYVDEAEFSVIYGPSIASALSDRRQYYQSQLQKAAQGTYDYVRCFRFAPTYAQSR